MSDAFRKATLWFTFTGSVLVIAVLYLAQAVIVPVALAFLLTFVLSPVITPLQRRLGGVAAVLLVVAVTFTGMGVAGWAVATQLASLVQELPTYQQNVRQKVRDVRWMGKGSSVEKLQETVEDIQSEIDRDQGPGTPAKPVVVKAEPVASLWGLPTIGSWLEPLATAALVMTLLIFMLLERQDLRNRLIRLFGHGQLAITTRAFDEAGQRVSRYLMAQSLINLIFGLGVGVGLYAIGVPYAVLWAALAAALRFVPYVGPLLAAAAPILVSLAAFEGWTRPFLVLGLYVGLELFTNFVVESFFYAGAAGVSQVGLLVAVAFWTWLWGPFGLLMATPLTVCLVVIGKYVPGFEFIATLMADTTVLESDVTYYQRLLAGDQAEAGDLIERYLKEGAPDTVYDAIFIPALNYAERDRIEGRLSSEEELAIVEANRELLEEAPRHPSEGSPSTDRSSHAGEEPMAVLGWPAHGESDVLALQMLGALLEDAAVEFTTLPRPALLAEGILALKERQCRVVCIADLPPSAPSKARHLVKRLRAAFPDLTILVGRWAPPAFADETFATLREAGADHVGTTLVETREALSKLLGVAPTATAPVDPPLKALATGGRAAS